MWLEVRAGSERGTRIEVTEAELVVGRAEECGLVLRGDAKVSRRHAEFVRDVDGRTRVRDLGSANGIYVNGERTEEAELKGGEQIQIGQTLIATHRERPVVAGDRTVIAEGGALEIPATPSAIQRLVVERSRRTTAIAGVAVAIAIAAAAFLVLKGGGEDESDRVAQVVSNAAPQTVFVEAARGGVRADGGTGWVLDASGGLVVTNAHVVNGGTEFSVGQEKEVADAKVVGVAPCEDLAVLRASGLHGLRQMSLGRQSSLRLGQTVVAVGYPGNAAGEARLTSTTGVVSVVRSAYRETAIDVPAYPNVVQTDAAINPGSSGGPLLDLDGRLVGVTAAARTVTPEGRVITGQGYAIGVDQARSVLSQLRRGISPGWLGLGFRYPTATELQAGNAGRGLRLLPSVPGSPGAKAGVGQRGDMLLALNGKPVGTTLRGYCDAVAGLRSGSPVTLRIAGREGVRSVRLRLG
jgi:S1-C subfamily serine protease